MVTVAGTVTDDGPVRLTIQGADVPVAKDGSFSTSINLASGLSLIETHAIDQQGNDVRDVRAVLAGATGQSDGSLQSPIGAHASPAALRTIASAMANAAEGIDYTAAAQAFNPIYDNGGCLGAKINITSVQISSIDATMAPGYSVLTTDVTLHNVVVKLHADFKVACIGGSTTITVTASAARIHGNLTADVVSGKIQSSLPSDTIALDNFDLNVSGVPSQIVDLFNSVVRGKVESYLATTIKNRVPPLVDSQLANLLTRPYTVNVLGHSSTVTVAANEVDLTPNGLFASANSTLAVLDGEGGMFAPSGATLSSTSLDSAQGIGVAVATDLVNELLAGLWAASSFDQNLPADQVAVLAALIDPNASSLDIKLLLPPQIVATSDGKLQLQLGDTMVTIKDAGGAELQKIALSVSTDLAVAPSQSGKMLLTLGQPTIYATMVEQDQNAPLTNQQAEGILNGVWGLISDNANQALSNVPLPSFGSLQVGAPTLMSMPGFVTADVSLQ